MWLSTWFLYVILTISHKYLFPSLSMIIMAEQETKSTSSITNKDENLPPLVVSHPGADCGSNHYIVVMIFRLPFKITNRNRIQQAILLQVKFKSSEIILKKNWLLIISLKKTHKNLGHFLNKEYWMQQSDTQDFLATQTIKHGSQKTHGSSNNNISGKPNTVGLTNNTNHCL